ncbi:uncharacterized protein VTP21DRAFT_7089 [Calcarisporiella thermophila]|uniref:uncharacterized protein n=1 Tax=Calcarisporiella thermophila TaxID=911321 RepID=UPI003744454B
MIYAFIFFIVLASFVSSLPVQPVLPTAVDITPRETPDLSTLIQIPTPLHGDRPIVPKIRLKPHNIFISVAGKGDVSNIGEILKGVGTIHKEDKVKTTGKRKAEGSLGEGEGVLGWFEESASRDSNSPNSVLEKRQQYFPFRHSRIFLTPGFWIRARPFFEFRRFPRFFSRYSIFA